MQLRNLEDLYLGQLRDLYSAEKQILKALPKIIDGAKNADLKEAFRTHLEQTKEHKKRLEQIFESHGKKPDSHLCKGMKGVLAEGSEVLDGNGASDVVDAGIIAAAQRVEHYEMAGYGTARAFARELGHEDDADLLQATLEEEAEADEVLTRIAEDRVNRGARA